MSQLEESPVGEGLGGIRGQDGGGHAGLLERLAGRVADHLERRIAEGRPGGAVQAHGAGFLQVVGNPYAANKPGRSVKFMVERTDSFLFG